MTAALGAGERGGAVGRTTFGERWVEQLSPVPATRPAQATPHRRLQQRACPGRADHDSLCDRV